MRLISHRGNINKPISLKENTSDYILLALEKGYDVEIDVWNINKEFYLGHDRPIEKLNLEWVIKYNNKLWIHSKDVASLEFFKNDFNTFYHTYEDYVLTSKNYIWSYVGKPLSPNIIAVLPEKGDYNLTELKTCFGICSDYIETYKNL